MRTVVIVGFLHFRRAEKCRTVELAFMKLLIIRTMDSPSPSVSENEGGVGASGSFIKICKRLMSRQWQVTIPDLFELCTFHSM